MFSWNAKVSPGDYEITVKTNDKIIYKAVERICQTCIDLAHVTSDIPEGEWIPDDYEFYHCSLCGYEQDERETVTLYCPGCGARMEEDEDD